MLRILLYYYSLNLMAVVVHYFFTETVLALRREDCLYLIADPSDVVVELRTVTKHFKVHLVNIEELLHRIEAQLSKILPC